MSQEEQKKIIGYVVVEWNGQNIAVDLYEGNQVIKPDGKTARVPEDVYEEILNDYHNAGGKFTTAYEYNQNEGIRVSKQSARPDALNPSSKPEKIKKPSVQTPPQTPPQESTPGKKKSASTVILIALGVIVVGFMALQSFLPALLGNRGTNDKSMDNSIAVQTFQKDSFDETQATDENASQPEAAEYVVAALAKDVGMSQMIQETDIKGVIVTSEQYEKYCSETYINSDGGVQYVSLILWDDKDSIIGKYAASDLRAGDLLYDTELTSQHVIADKTYIEAEINGENGIYEVEGGVLPGNTNIKIVAVITTDGGEPVQLLLSEMTLQDRSLESIFNSAGQDILEQLANSTSEN